MLEILYSYYRILIVLSPLCLPRTYRAPPSDTCHNTPGKEPDEDQPDQLLLSVTYFFQEHSKPLCQYRGTGKVVSYVLDIFYW